MNHVRQGPESAPSYGLLLTLIRRSGIQWCRFLSVTSEKETPMCRGVVGQPSCPQTGVRSRKLSGDNIHHRIGISATLCTLDCSFYLILNLFKFTKYLSIQKWDESTSVGFWDVTLKQLISHCIGLWAQKPYSGLRVALPDDWHLSSPLLQDLWTVKKTCPQKYDWLKYHMEQTNMKILMSSA